MVVQLGGFHLDLLMPNLGTVYYPMNGRKWKDLIHTCYRHDMNSIEKMMAGLAYYRAVRAQMFAHATIIKIVISLSAVMQLCMILINQLAWGQLGLFQFVPDFQCALAE